MRKISGWSDLLRAAVGPPVPETLEVRLDEVWAARLGPAPTVKGWAGCALSFLPCWEGSAVGAQGRSLNHVRSMVC